MRVLRWLNIFSGVLIGLCTFLVLPFLAPSIADYAREPEDTWLLIFWLLTLVALSALCFANAWAFGKARRD
jgi:hypothetical protein